MKFLNSSKRVSLIPLLNSFLYFLQQRPIYTFNWTKLKVVSILQNKTVVFCFRVIILGNLCHSFITVFKLRFTIFYFYRFQNIFWKSRTTRWFVNFRCIIPNLSNISKEGLLSIIKLFGSQLLPPQIQQFIAQTLFDRYFRWTISSFEIIENISNIIVFPLSFEMKMLCRTLFLNLNISFRIHCNFHYLFYL